MTSKEKQAAQLTGTCMIAFAVIIVSVFAVNWHKQRFFPSYEPGAAGSSSVAPVQLLSTIDLQRELNRRYPKLKLKEDGVYGTATKAAHERAIGDQYAKELMGARK